MDPRGRVQVIEQPMALPAECAVCKAAPTNGRKFVDWGWNFDVYGAVIICTECLVPVAEACGFIRYDEFKKAADALAIALDRGIEMERDRDRLKDLLDGLLGYDPAAPTNSISDDSSDESTEPENTSDEGPDDSESDEEQQRTPEPTAKPRSEDVPRPPESDGPRSFI